MPDHSYTYTGHIYDHDRNSSTLNLSLKMVMAGGDWPNIIKKDATTLVSGQMLASNNAITADKVKIKIPTNDGTTKLRGHLYTHAGGGGRDFYVLFLSGSGGPLHEYGAQVVAGYLATAASTKLQVRGVLAVDYRGFGLSRENDAQAIKGYKPTGVYLPTEAGVFTDASAMLAFLRHGLNVPANRIIIHGYSLGSGPAVELAANHACAGLILHGPMRTAAFNAYKSFTMNGLRLHSKKSIGSRIGAGAATLLSGGIVPGISFALGGISSAVIAKDCPMDNYSKIDQVTVPTLITSGPNDSMWEDAKALLAKAGKTNDDVTLAVNSGNHFEQGTMFTEDTTPYKATKYGNASAKQKLRAFLEGLPN
jgi:pimeloyl-ACP methyl ester carboxylesterase